MWVFGNPDLPADALPLKLLPKLKKHFPKTKFLVLDPLDEWLIPDELLIIDTVEGIDRVRVFTSLEAFSQFRRVTMHDFDLGLQLEFLKKLGKLPRFVIFGLPPKLSEKEAFDQLTISFGQYGV